MNNNNNNCYFILILKYYFIASRYRDLDLKFFYDVHYSLLAKFFHLIPLLRGCANKYVIRHFVPAAILDLEFFIVFF